MPFILIKGRFKPTVGIPDGESVLFPANSPTLWKKPNDTLLRLGTSDKSKDMTQAPSLKGIEALKTTTSKMNWLLTAFRSLTPFNNPNSILR